MIAWLLVKRGATPEPSFGFTPSVSGGHRDDG
jgi:hypothetical protein